MVVTHGGYLWVEDLVSKDVDLIAFITGMPYRGEIHMQYLDEKTKEKALAEEMNNTYGTKRGSHRIIIKRISGITTRLATKIMACKLLKKSCKEEFHVGLIVAATKCVQGTMIILAPYLLNLFPEDFKYAQDLGTEFHYSWLLMLITLIGWTEPKYTYFYERTSRCHAMRYISLGSTSDSKTRSENASMFAWYYNDLQEIISNTW
jgi:hypothetical protein